MTVVIPPLKGHFSWFLVSNIFCNPLFRLSTHHPLPSYPKTQFPLSLTRIPFVFVCASVCGRIFWTFFIRDGKNGASTSVIFSITFIYMMRNTAVFFCTRIVQTPVPRTAPLPFFTFEWSPEWESPDLMFHRTVLLLVGVFIIPHFFAIVNMANCKKCAFNFCRKSRNCNKCPISSLQTQKSVI